MNNYSVVYITSYEHLNYIYIEWSFVNGSNSSAYPSATPKTWFLDHSNCLRYFELIFQFIKIINYCNVTTADTPELIFQPWEPFFSADLYANNTLEAG